ncbi:hypothetical protein DNTS_020334 [Danionella cerebrum]|uniref:Ig-like domain-containing protein n=1 Tax=Danionella cerebrum TaxID=2873325 RepID=A0A553R4S7_9TELE|nr:hypothetical protein DNTS_020334 [Danionella translucida]
MFWKRITNCLIFLIFTELHQTGAEKVITVEGATVHITCRHPEEWNEENVQRQDSGEYNCKMTKMIPPPAMETNTKTILQVAGLGLNLLPVNDSCIHLVCSLDVPALQSVTFTWEVNRQTHNPLYKSNRSELDLCKPDWSDGDIITCRIKFPGFHLNKSIQLSPDSQCRKEDHSGSMVFTNKVYENFSFAMSYQNSQSDVKPQTEECIYEN